MFLCGLENVSIEKCVLGRVLWCVLYIDFWYDCCFPFTAPFLSYFPIVYIYIYIYTYIYNLYMYIFIYIQVYMYTYIFIHCALSFLFAISLYIAFGFTCSVIHTLPRPTSVLYILFCVYVCVYTCIHTTYNWLRPALYVWLYECVCNFPIRPRHTSCVHIHVYMNVYISHTYYRALSPIVLPVYLYIPRTCVSKRMWFFLSATNRLVLANTQWNRLAFQSRVSS